ncbi:MAG TPA: hypothetical protein PLT19_11410 [Syntrophorhabdaceae bacterium]|jgi:hypothetical protein|nr:hypothetical protein [Syntrophorhabdaceae bacterium]
MPTYSLDLQFLDPKKEGFPGAPVVQVYVKTHSRDAKGTIYISPQCVTLSEIEHECDRLSKEIATIRKKAQRKFAGR